MVDIQGSAARATSIGDTLDVGLRIFQRTVVRTLPLGALAILLGKAPDGYLQLAGRGSGNGPGLEVLKDPRWWIVSFLSELLIFVTLCAMLALQNAIVSGHSTSFVKELLRAFRRFPQIALLFILQMLSLIAGCIALIIPALYLAVPFGQAWPVLAIENTGAIEAYQTSIRLTRGSWWRVSTAGSVALVVGLVFYVVAAMLVGIAVQLAHSGDNAFYVVSTTLTLAFLALLAPFYSAFLLAMHLDLRQRQSQSAAPVEV